VPGGLRSVPFPGGIDNDDVTWANFITRRCCCGKSARLMREGVKGRDGVREGGGAVAMSHRFIAASASAVAAAVYYQSCPPLMCYF